MEALLILSVAVNVWMLYELRQSNLKLLQAKQREWSTQFFSGVEKTKRVYTKDMTNPRWQPKKRLYRKNPNNPYWKGRLA